MTTDPHALGAAYALDAVLAQEQELFRRHLTRCRNCRLEGAEFAATAAKLGAATAQPPPPQLKAVLNQVAMTRQAPPLTKRTRLRRVANPGNWVTAAAVLLAAVAAGYAASEHERASQLAAREQRRSLRS